MKLLEDKFTHAYASGANAIAIQVDHHKIIRYILEYSDLQHIGVLHVSVNADVWIHTYMKQKPYRMRLHRAI
ncbi:hypothetical protein [Bacillus mycoides]|uniref:hypothetical protein n=1 Tax=Bacillus mycoides TaxID=1405 RepID=UPI001F43F4D0|nr:hypothetical protein [Bacillus mycoides]